MACAAGFRSSDDFVGFLSSGLLFLSACGHSASFVRSLTYDLCNPFSACSRSSFPAALLWFSVLSAACFGLRFSQSTAMIIVTLGLLSWFFVSLDLLLWPSFCLGLQC